MAELTYRETGVTKNGEHTIDAYEGKELVMTYKGYALKNNPNVLILYPSVAAKYGADVPGKHAVSVFRVQK